MERVNAGLGLVVLGWLLNGCGPSLSTAVRIADVRAPNNSGTATEDGVVVEVPDLKEIPPQFKLTVATCGANGQPNVLSDGSPVTKELLLLPEPFQFYAVKFANQTDHVIRLQGSVIRLFDPAENQHEPLSKEDLAAHIEGALPKREVCAQEAAKVKAALGSIRLIGPNTEVLPGTTVTGYAIFSPPNVMLAGTWKLSLYEVPTKVDATGAPTRKARFEFGYLRKKFEDTFSQAAFGERKLVSTREVQ